jgi:peptidyl-prolyl cis-trans isomerase D
MLDIFRSKGIANVVYGVIIVATILVFVIQFRPMQGQKQASLKTTCVATVRGWCIDPKDHRAAMLLLIRSGGELSPQQVAQLHLRDVALDGLIERELLVGEAARLGISVGDQEVTDQLFDGFIHISVPSDNLELQQRLRIGPEGLRYLNFKDPKTKSFDMKLYERRIKNETGRSPAEFREEQTRELLAAKMRDLIRAPIRVSEAEAYEAYLRQYNTATVSYAQVKPAWASEWAVSVTDADVAAYGTDHKADVDKEFDARKDGDLPKEKRVRHILASFHPSARPGTPPAPPTPEERAAAWGRISDAMARLKRGEPFAQVARDLSDDPGSKNKGGGYDSMEGFDPFFKRTADALAPGGVTQGAIETVFGFHILMKDDPSKSADVEAAIRKAIPRALLLKSKGADAAKDIAKKMIDAMKGGKSAEDAVKAASASLTKPAPEPCKIFVDDVKPDAGAAAADAGAAGDAGAKAAAGDAGAKVAPLPMKAPTADADPRAPKVEVSMAFSSGGDPFPGLAQDGMAAVLLFAFKGKDGDVIDEPAHGTDGPFALQIKERHVATRDDFDKERDVQLGRLVTAKQNEALALYVRRLRETAKNEIKKDEALLKEPDGGVAEDEP